MIPATARAESEAALTTMLTVLGDEWRPKITAAMGSPPSASNIPSDLWTSMESAYRERSAAILLGAYVLGLGYVATNIGDVLPAEVAPRAQAALVSDRARIGAATFAGQRATDFAGIFTTNTRERIEAAAAMPAPATPTAPVPIGSAPAAQPPDLTPTLPTPAEIEAEITAELDRTFGKDRAETAGVTETTSGITSGQRDGVRIASDATGRVLLLYWLTEQDGLVCPVCAPLHGVGQNEWALKFPQGPPAHPNCRCELELRPSDFTNPEDIPIGEVQ